MVDVSTLLEKYPSRPIVIFPECTTTNGRGILPLSPSVVSVPSSTRIFPVSLRYTPVDVVTPLPGAYLTFLWTLLSRPTHCIRVRIAEFVMPGSPIPPFHLQAAGPRAARSSASELQISTDKPAEQHGLTGPETAVLDYVAESLARLGRVKRVGLGVKEKQDFVRMWTKTRRAW